MTPLDLRLRPPRSARATLLGIAFLPRTIDKLRAELPGGCLGTYLNHGTGFSAWVVRRCGLDMDAFRAAVAEASDEDEIVAWIAARVDPAIGPALNAKLETFVVDRMSFPDQQLIRERHPVIALRPELSTILDILDADDAHAFPPPA
jgi:hypothetical protein